MKTRILAIVGVILLWFTLLAPVVLSMSILISKHILRFDYLMPGELFLMALAGGLILTWVAFRAQYLTRLIAGEVTVATISLVGSQVFAVISGVASGAVKDSWQLSLVIAMFVVYWLALIAIGIGGIQLLRKVF